MEDKWFGLLFVVAILVALFTGYKWVDTTVACHNAHGVVVKNVFDWPTCIEKGKH